MIKKKILNPVRVRQINGGFSFIPHRFLADGFLASLDQKELLLYLFLVLVSDRNGLSFYSYDSICSLLQMRIDQYIKARDSLMEKDLIAFNGTLFQVLDLPVKLPDRREKRFDLLLKHLFNRPLKGFNMIDDKAISTIEWTDERLKEIESVIKVLDQAIEDYLQWMAENGYAKSTRKEYARVLRWFKLFIKKRRCLWDEIFTQKMLQQFKKSERPYPIHAVTGLSRYLFEQGKIARHLGTKDQSVNLPQTYEDYLFYHQKTFQASNRKIKHIKVVLIAFHKFFKKHRIKLCTLTIERIDAFLSEYFVGYKENTRRVYRSHLRGFLRYLFHERKLLSTDLAPLIVGAPQFSKAKPPNFLRPHELKRLFAGLKLSSAGDLRVYAMVHLAYTLGLRPCEISSICLDDIFFKDAQLCIRIRKNDKPVRLPVPEETIKAIAAYLIGGRPKSKHRELFLTLYPPYRKLAQNTVTQHIKTCMLSVGMTYSAYCLRHTYAQNLLEAGLSIYEVKEMMGHDSIESTRKYLHVHIKLMRKVLFDETL